MHDWFAELTMYSAWMAIALAVIALVFELRNRLRKSERDRLVASINNHISPAVAASPEEVVFDIEALIDSQFAHNLELENKLREDLQSLAILSVVNDRVIPETLLSVTERLRNPETFGRWQRFVNDWVETEEQTPIESLPEADRRRGIYELGKKKRMIARKLLSA